MTAICQRWRDGRHVFTRAPIRSAEFDVAAIADDATPRAFVEQHHYSRSYPAARRRFGLYRFGQLVGCAVFSHPTNDAVLTRPFPSVRVDAAAELGRLVLLDEIGANAESFFVARCFEQLRADGFRAIVSFSDPMPRAALDGRTVMPGHVGIVYQALNAKYLGPATPRTLRLLPDGRALSARSIQKIRAGEKGWIGAAERLEAFGVPSIDRAACRLERLAWLNAALARVTRRIRHPGNHKYVWTLDRRVQLQARTFSYPKREAA